MKKIFEALVVVAIVALFAMSVTGCASFGVSSGQVDGDTLKFGNCIHVINVDRGEIWDRMIWEEVSNDWRGFPKVRVTLMRGYDIIRDIADDSICLVIKEGPGDAI